MGEILCGLRGTCRAGFWRITKKFGCCRPGSMPVRQCPIVRLRWVEDVSSSIGVTNRVLVFWQFYSFKLTGTRPVLKQRSYTPLKNVLCLVVFRKTGSTSWDLSLRIDASWRIRRIQGCTGCGWYSQFSSPQSPYSVQCTGDLNIISRQVSIGQFLP